MSRVRSFLVACTLLLGALCACEPSVEVLHDASAGGGGADAVATTAQSGGGGQGGVSGGGGAGGEACDDGLGTDCDPIRVGLLFDGNASARALAIDSVGDVLIAGYFQSLDLGEGVETSVGDFDLYLAKLDGVSGEVLWHRTFGMPEWDPRVDLALDADDNVIIAGTARAPIDFGGGPICDEGFSQVYLVKLDATGEHVFSRCFGNPATSTAGPQPQVAVTPSGAIVLFGKSDDDIDLGTGVLAYDEGVLFVATYAADGHGLWSRKYGEIDDSPNAYARALEVDASGNLVLGVSFSGRLDFEGLVTESDDDFNGLVVKLDPFGDFVWGTVLQGDADTVTVAVGPAGEVAAGVRSVHAVQAAGRDTQVDGSIVLLDSEGGLRWVADPSTAPTSVAGLGVDPAGNVLALEHLAPSVMPAGADVGLTAFSPAGAQLFERNFGSGAGWDLQLRGDKVALCGQANDTPGLDFGDGLLVSGAEYGLGVFAAWFEPWQSAAP